MITNRLRSACAVASDKSVKDGGFIRNGGDNRQSFGQSQVGWAGLEPAIPSAFDNLVTAVGPRSRVRQGYVLGNTNWCLCQFGHHPIGRKTMPRGREYCLGLSPRMNHCSVSCEKLRPCGHFHILQITISAVRSSIA